MMATPEQRKQMEQLKQAKGEPNVDHRKVRVDACTKAAM
jgi:hypothetical protein